jgi:NAD(P)-dependent dehydrogenase (short-subunit alcohol dehydrogenase family)
MGSQIVLVTDTSNGLGRLSAQAMACRGHTVYAVGHQDPVDRVVATIIAAHGHIDVIVHSAGPAAFGPAEAFTPEQFAGLYDLIVLSAQRINRAALPHMRRRGRGLLIWVSSSGLPPYLAPTVAAKAAMDALAVQYARELARWGIETSIVVAGAFTRGTAEAPADQARLADYSRGPTAGLDDDVRAAFARIVPDDADAVAKVIAGLVDTPCGERPFRVHIESGDDGAEMLHRLGLQDLLRPAWRKPQ